MRAMLERLLAGTAAEGLEEVETVAVAALAATATEVLRADGFILGTPANIGYMSGALKHFFDEVYYPCLDARRGAPYGLYVHGNSDTVGAVRAVESIAVGMGWTRAQLPVIVRGTPTKDDLGACWNLGASVAANLLH
jgi:NAD(P)H-dependent FMN reductase